MCHSGKVFSCLKYTNYSTSRWFGVHSSKVQKQQKTLLLCNFLFQSIIIVILMIVIINRHSFTSNKPHRGESKPTGIQSSYKSKFSQKYASLLYIANIYLCFFQSIQNLWYNTHPVLTFQHIFNISTELHILLENRSFFAIQPYPRFSIWISSSFRSFCIILHRWSQSVNIDWQE